MLHLYTGLPGASKTLNTITNLVSNNDCTRTIYYNNVKLLMLDMEVCDSFQGWFYGAYLPNIKDKLTRKRVDKIVKRIHDTGEMVSLDDVPFLAVTYEAFNNVELWLYWVHRLYTKKQLEPLDDYLALVDVADLNFSDLKTFNLHFVHFDNPLEWHHLPKRSVIFIDEVQEFFPLRSAGSRVPDAVQALEKHRHSGWDLHWITQDAMLVDVNVRRQTGFHCNYYNSLGGKRLSKIESPKVFNPSDYFQTKSLNKSMVKHNTRFYGSYFSAEIHTHKFKVPKFLFYGVAALVLAVIPIIYFSTSFLNFSDDVNETSTVSTVPVSASSSASPSTLTDSDIVRPVPKKSPNEYAFLDVILKNVYISGSLMIKRETGTFIDYVLEDSKAGKVFHAENIGVTLNPISKCLVKVEFDSYQKYITCNPLSDSPDEDFRDENSFDVANNEGSQKPSNLSSIKLF